VLKRQFDHVGYAVSLYAKDEFENLMSHFAISRSSWGGRSKLPYAFTEYMAILAVTIAGSCES
jgi:hypothetical protein